MAKKIPKKRTKNHEYKVFRDYFEKYSPYAIALEKSQDPDNPDIRGLKRLAVENVPEALAHERERVSKTNDPEAIFKFFNIGHKRTQKDFEIYGDNNIKTLIKETPKRNLELILASVELKSKDFGNYGAVVNIHKDYKKMYETLAIYQDKESDEEDKEKSLKTMEKRLVRFYVSEHGTDKETLDALKYLAKIDTELKVIRYMGFIGDKRKEFDAKVGDNLGPYLRDSVKNKLALYAMIASDLKKRR